MRAFHLIKVLHCQQTIRVAVITSDGNLCKLATCPAAAFWPCAFPVMRYSPSSMDQLFGRA